MSEILRQGEAHGGVRPLDFFVVEEIRPAVRCSAEDSGPFVNAMVP